MSKVDLFIPTYNRPIFLERLLNFYSLYKFPHRIIIADSSSDSNKKLNKKVVTKFKDLNIKYLDKFSPKQVSHQKFGEMVKYAKAPFTVFCADDDFLFPSGIEQAVDFLEKNPDYSSAHGTYISFYINEDLPFINKFLWRYIYPYESINYADPVNRLKAHMNNYYQVLWAVRRTDQLKLIYKEFLKSKASPVLFGELLPDMLTLVFGKMKRLNTFYSARQAFSTAYGYWPTLQNAIKKGGFEEEYRLFKKCLIRNVRSILTTGSRSLKKEKDQVEEIVDQGMKAHLKQSNQEHLTYEVNLFLQKYVSFLAGTFRKLHVAYLYSKQNRDRIGQIDNQDSRYFKDFEILKKVVLN